MAPYSAVFLQQKSEKLLKYHFRVGGNFLNEAQACPLELSTTQSGMHDDQNAFI